MPGQEDWETLNSETQGNLIIITKRDPDTNLHYRETYRLENVDMLGC